MSENEDKYHDTILDLEEKLKKNVDLFLKIGNSLQAMFMLGPKPLSVYDQQLKHGLGYPNPYTLRQAISECPKLYVASRTGNIEIPLNVRDSEETLEDAFKSQQKMNKKMNDPIAVANKQNCWTIDYKQLNALYNDFVPQKESFVEQTCSSSSYIPFVKILETKSMPSELPLINGLFNIKVGFEKLFLLIKQNSKRASMFYTSKEEIALNDFCRDQITTINSAAQPTHDQEDSPSTSSIIVDTHEAPPVFVPYDSLNHEEIESSTMNLEPSNVQNFHQVQPSTHIWTKDHPLDQVIGDPSKPVMTRQWLHTNFEIRRPEGKLKKALYDLKQAPHSWGDILVVQVYVDDIIFGLTNQDFSKRFANLMKNNFEMSMMGELKFFLRLQVHQSPRGIFISQSQYAIELLKKHGLDECVSMSTPMATERLDADLQGTPTDQMTYRRMIGGIMYLTASRPDIAFATFSYNMGLWYPKDSGFELIAYSDADHAMSNAEAEYDETRTGGDAEHRWMITDEMKLTEHYKMYAEVFGLDVPLTQSQPTESTQGTHRTPSAPSREEQEARENVALVYEHLAAEEIEKLVENPKNVDDSSPLRHDDIFYSRTRLEPRSDKESPEVEIVQEKEEDTTKDTEVEPDKDTPMVDVINIVPPVNVDDKEDEITDEVFELRRRVKGKNVEETRISPIPSPTRSPRNLSTLVSSDTEKLQELTVTHPTPIIQKMFMPRTSSDQLTDNLHDVMMETLPSLVKEKVTEQVKKEVPAQVRDQVPVYLAEGLILERKMTKEETERLILKLSCQELICRVIIIHVHSAQSSSSSVQKTKSIIPCSMKDDSFEPGPSTSGNQEQDDEFDFWTDSYASDDDEIPTKQVTQDIMEEISLTIDEAKLKKMADEMLRQRCTSRDEHQYHIDQMKNSCKDPEAPALSLINQDLLYLKKGNSGPEKIVLSLHKFPAIVFNDDDIEERTSRWVNKCIKNVYLYARLVLKTGRILMRRALHKGDRKNLEDRRKRSIQTLRSFKSSRHSGNWVMNIKPGLDPRTCGLWAYHASATRDCPNLKTLVFVPDDAVPIYDTEAEPELNKPGDELVYPDRGEVLVIQRVLNVAVSKSVDDNSWLRNNIFRTKCTFKGKIYDMIIDAGSYENVVSTYMVEKLGMKIEDHPKPY
ncbi:retrovirus-related pol polyprotein from transposon TNT 1-94 [Tanacetum coccineum]